MENYGNNQIFSKKEELYQKELFNIDEFKKSLENHELTTHQKKAAVCYVILRQACEHIGIEIQDFEPENIFNPAHLSHPSHLEYGEDKSMMYHPAIDENFIQTKIVKPEEFTFSIIVHEMIHYYSSQWNIASVYEERQKTSDMQNISRPVKSGLYSVYNTKKLDENNEEIVKSPFYALNESATEFVRIRMFQNTSREDITRLYLELFPDDIDKELAPNFEFVKKEVQKEIKFLESSTSNLKEAISNQQNEDIRTNQIHNLESYQRDLDTIPSDEEEYVEYYFLKEIEIWRQQVLEYEQGAISQPNDDYYKRYLKLSKATLEKKENALKDYYTNPVIKTEYFEQLHEYGDAYERLSPLVTDTLVGYTYYLLNNDLEKNHTFKEVYTQVSDSFLKNYMVGNTAGIRFIDTVYGEGFLRSISYLNPYGPTKELSEAVKKISVTNSQLKETYDSRIISN